MDWAQVASDFEWDGSLLDIRLSGTTIADWQDFLDALRRRIPSFTFTLDGAAADMPLLVEEILAFRQRSTPLLSFEVGAVRLNCHFFSTDEIELDLDPRDVVGEEQLRALVELMGLAANATGKLAVLTNENMPAAIIFGRTPGASGAIWWPPRREPGAGLMN